MATSQPLRRRGMTIQDYLVVGVVVGLILLLAIPWVFSRREDSRRLLCEKRTADLARATLIYADQHNEFPGYRNELAISAAGERQPIGWVYPLLPYLVVEPESEEARELAALHLRHGPQGPDETRGVLPEHYLPRVICPASVADEATDVRQGSRLSYVVNCGQPDNPAATAPIPPDWPSSGVFFNRFPEPGLALFPMRPGDLRDGDSQTLLFSENLDAGPWTSAEEARVGFLWVPEFVDGVPAPGDRLLRINQQGGTGDGSVRFARPSSHHLGGVNTALADGRAMFLSEEVDWIFFAQLMISDKSETKFAGEDRPAPPPYRIPSDLPQDPR